MQGVFVPRVCGLARLPWPSDGHAWHVYRSPYCVHARLGFDAPGVGGGGSVAIRHPSRACVAARAHAMLAPQLCRSPRAPASSCGASPLVCPVSLPVPIRISSLSPCPGSSVDLAPGQPRLRVLYTGPIGGDRAIVADRPFPHYGPGHPLPFVWHTPCVGPDGAVREDVGPQALAYFEVTIERLPEAPPALNGRRQPPQRQGCVPLLLLCRCVPARVGVPVFV